MKHLLQYFFNTAGNHLLTMNEKSKNEAGSCLYRTPENNCCAVGALIEDSVYVPVIENKTAIANVVIDLVLQSAVIKKVITEKEKEEIRELESAIASIRTFLIKIQEIHDEANPDEFLSEKRPNIKRKLTNIAKDYGLENLQYAQP